MPISDARLEKLRELGKMADAVIGVRNELTVVNRELLRLQSKKSSLQSKLSELRQTAEDDLGRI
jgi:hypothetical protein